MELNLSIRTKLVLAIITVIISLVMGVYTKFMFVLHMPYYIDWWNLFWYIMSWVLLFVAAFFVGKEALEIADLYVKRKLQETYTATVDLHKEGFKRGIETTRRGYETTKDIGKKTIHFHKRMLGIDELEFKRKKRK